MHFVSLFHMRNFTLLLLFIIPFSKGIAQDTIKVFYDKNWNVIDNNKDAQFFSVIVPTESSDNFKIADYYISGQIQMTTVFKVLSDSIDWTKIYTSKYNHAVKNGPCTWYFPTGLKQELVTYKMGKLHGKGNEWYSNGNLRTEANFSNGIAEDTVYMYFETGQLKRKYFMFEGKVKGLYQEWYENGQIKLSTEMNQDFFEGKFKSWHENGQKEIESQKRMGRDIPGTYKKWNPTGALLEEK